MLTIKIIMICLIVYVLWFLMILYKNKWMEECDLTSHQLKFEMKLINDYTKQIDELIVKNKNIERELLSRDKKYNELLSEYNKLKNNRVAKIIKEEKIKHE